MRGGPGADDVVFAPPRTRAFPPPPFPFSYSDGLFAPACFNLGVALHHLPQARNSVAYGGRAKCSACSNCLVCPTGAQASIDLTHIPQAEATGKAEIRPEATVFRLETDSSGGVSAAEYSGGDSAEPRTTSP